MKSTKIAGDAGYETRVVILDSGEEAFAALIKSANDALLTAASLTAIGAFENATIGWFLLAATAQNLRRLARLRPINILPEMLPA
jgi:predicted DNA-binding protein with PD1-like motif